MVHTTLFPVYLEYVYFKIPSLHPPALHRNDPSENMCRKLGFGSVLDVQWIQLFPPQ